MIKKPALEQWSIKDAKELYGINNWGENYFDISSEGEVVVTPFLHKDISVSIPRIIAGLKDRGLEMPVLLRIENILDSQIAHLHNTFGKAIKDFNYQGEFRGVYPIKVNQQQQVVEEVTDFGSRYHHGLEAGSKAELLTAMSYLKDEEACLICNGYKDREFVDLGLYARKMGLKCFFVLEMPSELSLILERAEALNIRPLIGLRIKISSQGGGHWAESAGDRSIFGLSTAQIVDVLDVLREKEMLDCVQLLHYHLGSQISNIRDIRSAVLEASRVYAGLYEEGANMRYLDLGGGLAVDYDGSHTNFMNSRNYSIEEYCADIIETVMGALDDKEIPHPHIITESGRAIVAYYSVLLFNILDVSSVELRALPDKLPEESPEQIEYIFDVYKNLSLKNLQECYNDALYYRDEIRQLFRLGSISLRERSVAENIFWHIVTRIADLSHDLKHVPPDIQKIEIALADIYYGNFSVFQSLPDSWAIDHLFPVMPVHRLKELPEKQAVVADITCDCDGKIDRFIDMFGVKHTLSMHEVRENEEYFVGVFLVGAYQETLGDLHNLLGDTNVVSLRVYDDGSYSIVREVEGDSVADVLSYVEYNPKALLSQFRTMAEESVRQGKISPLERYRIMKAFEAVLWGYTYLE